MPIKLLAKGPGVLATTAILVPNVFHFPCGELGIKLDLDRHDFWYSAAERVTLCARIQSSNDVMGVILGASAFREKTNNETPLDLFLPYVPYARQDRVCVPGEPFSLKAFAQIVNTLNFRSVTVCDPHSDVVGAVFDRIKIVSQEKIIQRFDALSNRINGNPNAVFVSPDTGANKKTSVLASYFGHNYFIRADKLRDLATGKIKETIVYAEDLTGYDVFIVDDLADAGGTFIALAKELKKKGAAKVILYVTHGAFTKGTDILFNGGIDEIYTTNSYYDVWPAGISDKVITFNVEEFAK